MTRPNIRTLTPLERKAFVVAELTVRGLTFAALARQHGGSQGSYQNALLVPSDPKEKVIAEAIGWPQEELFWDRYDASGNRLHRVQKNSTGKFSGAVKNDKAA